MTPPVYDEGAGTRRAFRLVGVPGILVVACILTGTAGGIKLDGLFDTGGAFTALGVLAGVGAGLALAGWVLIRASGGGPPRP